MSIDVVDLRNFYGQRLGVVARRFVGRGIRSLWRDTAGQRVLGVGYATPYLGLFREEAERCLAFMPAGSLVISNACTSSTRSTALSGSGSSFSSTSAVKAGRTVGHFTTPCPAGMKARQRSASSRNRPR